VGQIIPLSTGMSGLAEVKEIKGKERCLVWLTKDTFIVKFALNIAVDNTTAQSIVLFFYVVYL
jgi:hypothetical protein